MLNYYPHSSFNKETAKLKRGRFISINKAIEDFKRLAEVQFNPLNPQQIIAPSKLHRVTQNAVWSIWKIELAIPKSGLKPNQFPRMWFAIKGQEVALLVIVSHIDGYDNNKMDRLAAKRVNDIF
jgi:hypothetical protein